MNSKRPLIISLTKSTIRAVDDIVTFITGLIIPLTTSIIAEIGGVLEELFDKRWFSYFIGEVIWE